MEYEDGEAIGRFRIEGVLGRGGMAVVYRARELGLERLVALKVISPHLAADASFRARFVREAQLAASLEHPNIVPVYAADEYQGKLFIAMRLIDGTDLSTRLSEVGRLNVGEALEIARPIADALDEAHQHGLVHRDVKPGNILVGRPGRGRAAGIYLTDFGVVHETGMGLSMPGSLIGTVDYMSPEQIDGTEGVDGRADEYSLACTLFEMLAGTPPFPRHTSMQAMHAHVYDEPPALSSLLAGTPPGLDDVIARALAKDPANRYQTCLELVDAVQDAVAGERPAEAPEVPRDPKMTIVDTRPGTSKPTDEAVTPPQRRRAELPGVAPREQPAAAAERPAASEPPVAPPPAPARPTAASKQPAIPVDAPAVEEEAAAAEVAIEPPAGVDASPAPPPVVADEPSVEASEPPEFHSEPQVAPPTAQSRQPAAQPTARRKKPAAAQTATSKKATAPPTVASKQPAAPPTVASKQPAAPPTVASKQPAAPSTVASSRRSAPTELRSAPPRREGPAPVRQPASPHARRSGPPRMALFGSIATLAVAGIAGGAWYASHGSGPTPTVPNPPGPTPVPQPPTPPNPPEAPTKVGWPPANSAAAVMRFAGPKGRLDNQARYKVVSAQTSLMLIVTQRRGRAAVDVPRITVPLYGAAHLWARFSPKAGVLRFDIGCYGQIGKSLTCLRSGEPAPAGMTASARADRAHALGVLRRLQRYANIAAAPDLRGLEANGIEQHKGVQRCARTAGAKTPQLVLCVQRAGVVTEVRTKTSHVTLQAVTWHPPESAIEEPHA